MFIISCSKQGDISNASVKNQSIGFNQLSQEEFPYADTNTLKSFSNDKAILNYTFAKKLALLELMSTQQWQKNKWEACTLSETPVIIYDFNSKPKYYEYIVLDPEKKAIGSITAYAQKKSSTIIRSTSTSTPTFTNVVTKSSSVKYFQDWSGATYTAVPSKSGNAPTQVTNDSGKIVSDVKEVTDEQIVEIVAKNVVALNKQNDSLAKTNNTSNAVNKELENKLTGEQKQIISTASTPQTEVSIKQNLNVQMENKHKETNVYWNKLDEVKDSINNISVTEITQKSTKCWFCSWVSWWPQPVYEEYKIAAYENKLQSIGRGGYCGPWVANYINFVINNRNEYNYMLQFTENWEWWGMGRPMFPFGFTLALGSRYIWVPPFLFPGESFAYNWLKNVRQPLIRLCWTKGQMHWTLCFGVKRTGNTWWSNYTFFQTDNGAKNGQSIIEEEMDWWSSTLIVLN